MGNLALRVAARWTVQSILGAGQAVISPDVVAWVEARTFTAKADYLRDLQRLDLVKDKTFEPLKTLDDDAFSDAKDSIEVMLSKVLQTLGNKFRGKFYMRATQQRLKLYYYFSEHYALETIALTLTMKHGQPLLWLGYIPTKITGGSDVSKALHEQVLVRDPAMAGLALMRLLRALLARID